MFNFIRGLVAAIFTVTAIRRKNLIFTMLMLRKQNEILKRQINARNERIRISISDRSSLAMILSICSAARSHMQLFKPETVLAEQRRFISKCWTYPNCRRIKETWNRFTQYDGKSDSSGFPKEGSYCRIRLMVPISQGSVGFNVCHGFHDD
jgi:hypothetical protein